MVCYRVLRGHLFEDDLQCLWGVPSLRTYIKFQRIWYQTADHCSNEKRREYHMAQFQDWKTWTPLLGFQDRIARVSWYNNRWCKWSTNSSSTFSEIGTAYTCQWIPRARRWRTILFGFSFWGNCSFRQSRCWVRLSCNHFCNFPAVELEIFWCRTFEAFCGALQNWVWRELKEAQVKGRLAHRFALHC